MDEQLETGVIIVRVNHPDYCADLPERVVDASPPANAPFKEKLKYVGARLTGKVRARPDPVVLKRGGVLRVTGFIGTRDNVVTNLAAEVSERWKAGTSYWHHVGSALWTKKAVPGKTFLRAMCFPPNGPAYFSSMISFMVGAGKTNLIDLNLEPGVRVTGRLDDSVPRPVIDGRVLVRVFEESEDWITSAPVWVAWRPVTEDGRFAFESLPPGRMEIIGTCDGFVSSNGPPWKGQVTRERIPQQFRIAAPGREITVQMEATAACEVTILDDTGKPLPGAKAGFSPNAWWADGSTTIFGETYNSEDEFRITAPPAWKDIVNLTRECFQVSDANGVALVRTLPAGSQDYSVTHTNYAMPISGTGAFRYRSASVYLSPGETGRVTVRMQKLGTEELTH
jgi:hypothetical protein